MTQLQGFGALLHGAVALAFVGLLAVLFGGPLEITLALGAMFAAYASQYCSFIAELNVVGAAAAKLARCAIVLMLLSVAAAAFSFVLSVWF